jgi:Mg2+ and Co2+ transporter CorA
VEESVIKRLTDRQLLWMDLSGDDDAELRRIADLFGLERQSVQNLLDPIGPRVDVLENYFEVDVVALTVDERAVPMDFVAGKNWVVTVHHEEVDFLAEFRKQQAGNTELGRIQDPPFWPPSSTGSWACISSRSTSSKVLSTCSTIAHCAGRIEWIC